MVDAQSGDSVGSRIDETFASAILSLNEGQQLFPAPFDALSSAALASNRDIGPRALGLFDGTVSTRELRFRLLVEHVVLDDEGHETVRRELIDTVVDSPYKLVALVQMLATEATIPVDRAALFNTHHERSQP